MKFKVCDRVVVKRTIYSGNVIRDFKISGVITEIRFDSMFPIHVAYDKNIEYRGERRGSWWHRESSLEFENTGFDPKRILDKVFGVRGF